MRSTWQASSRLVAPLLLAGCTAVPTPVPGSTPCEPGGLYQLACGCGVGVCAGDPTLGACDGVVAPEDCTSASHLAYGDDDCGTYCPSFEVTCPPSGALTIVAAPYSSGASFTCEWVLRRVGADPDAGTVVDAGPQPTCTATFGVCEGGALPCCDPAARCVAERGVCDTTHQYGESCGDGLPCQEGALCDRGVCRAPGGAGASCTTDQQCFYSGRCEIPAGETLGSCRDCYSAPFDDRCCDWDYTDPINPECAGCTMEGYRCARDSECCSGSCGTDGDCEGCIRQGACLDDRHCCSGSCDDGTCAACAATGASCSGDDDVEIACCDPAARCVAGACCVPDCSRRECGSDGCGGSCGTCAAGTCRSLSGGATACCVPDCSGRACGDDGCGGSCGTCAGFDSCNTTTGQCEPCVPNCTGRACGDDRCGGSCGSCAAGQRCTGGGACCTPTSCAGRECGSDGCGGTCGTCPSGETCRAPSYTCEPICARSGERCTGPGAVDCCGGYTCGRADGSYTLCCATFGTACTSGSQCCSGYCNAGTCAACSGC